MRCDVTGMVVWMGWGFYQRAVASCCAAQFAPTPSARPPMPLLESPPPGTLPMSRTDTPNLIEEITDNNDITNLIEYRVK